MLVLLKTETVDCESSRIQSLGSSPGCTSTALGKDKSNLGKGSARCCGLPSIIWTIHRVMAHAVTIKTSAAFVHSTIGIISHITALSERHRARFGVYRPHRGGVGVADPCVCRHCIINKHGTGQGKVRVVLVLFSGIHVLQLSNERTVSRRVSVSDESGSQGAVLSHGSASVDAQGHSMRICFVD